MVGWMHWRTSWVAFSATCQFSVLIADGSGLTGSWCCCSGWQTSSKEPTLVSGGQACRSPMPETAPRQPKLRFFFSFSQNRDSKTTEAPGKSLGITKRTRGIRLRARIGKAKGQEWETDKGWIFFFFLGKERVKGGTVALGDTIRGSWRDRFPARRRKTETSPPPLRKPAEQQRSSKRKIEKKKKPPESKKLPPFTLPLKNKTKNKNAFFLSLFLNFWVTNSKREREKKKHFLREIRIKKTKKNVNRFF